MSDIVALVEDKERSQAGGILEAGSGCMSEPVKAAMILAIGIVVGVAIWTYFSPFHSCVRSLEAKSVDMPEVACAKLLGQRRF